MFGALKRESYLYSLLISVLFQLSLGIFWLMWIKIIFHMLESLSEVTNDCILREILFWPLHCNWYFWPFTPGSPFLPRLAWPDKVSALLLPLQSFLLFVLQTPSQSSLPPALDHPKGLSFLTLLLLFLHFSSLRHILFNAQPLTGFNLHENWFCYTKFSTFTWILIHFSVERILS